MSNRHVSPRLHDLLTEAAQRIGAGSYTTADEIEDELIIHPSWLDTYGLEEIQLRDLVIAKLMKESV